MAAGSGPWGPATSAYASSLPSLAVRKLPVYPPPETVDRKSTSLSRPRAASTWVTPRQNIAERMPPPERPSPTALQRSGAVAPRTRRRCPDLFGLRQIDGRDRFRRNWRMLAEAEHDILEAFFQLVRRHHLRCVNPGKFRAIGHVLQPDGEFRQDFLNVLQVAAKFIGAIARRQNPFFKGAVPFRRHRPQILVQHSGDGFGEYLAARIFLHGFARESEQLKQALQRAGLHAVLIGQWLGGDAGVQFGEKLRARRPCRRRCSLPEGSWSRSRQRSHSRMRAPAISSCARKSGLYTSKSADAGRGRLSSNRRFIMV